MGLEQVIGEVQTGGERRAQDLLDEARAEAGSIITAAQEKVAAYEAQRKAQAARDIEQLHGQAISHAEFEARKLSLEAEAELREQLRSVLLEGFADLPAAARKKHLTALLKQAKDVVPAGRVWGAKKDEAVLKASDYDFAGTADIAGGLIVEDKGGRVRLDLSYETLIDDRWRDILRAESALFS